jgi:hypothetical protein
MGVHMRYRLVVALPDGKQDIDFKAYSDTEAKKIALSILKRNGYPNISGILYEYPDKFMLAYRGYK